MKNYAFLGRILYAIPFILFGINHFINVEQLIDANFISFIPLGPFTIMLTGVLLIAAGISIITKKFMRLSTTLLASLLLIFIATIHIPHLINHVGNQAQNITTLLKDISLMGGSLMIAGLSNEL